MDKPISDNQEAIDHIGAVLEMGYTVYDVVSAIEELKRIEAELDLMFPEDDE